MITLDEIFGRLSHGEFSQVQLGAFDPTEDESSPDPRQYAQLNHFLNAGLRNIYSKFFLAADQVWIQPDPTLELYPLLVIYAQSNTASPEPIKFIMDSATNPFQENVLKIEQLFNVDDELLPLSYKPSAENYWTPNYRSIHVPTPVPENPEMFKVVYRAAHPKIEFTSADEPEDIELELPPQFFDAMVYYMASCFFAGTESPQETTFYQKYLAQLQMIDQEGLYMQPDYWETWRFEQNGWV